MFDFLLSLRGAGTAQNRGLEVETGGVEPRTRS